MKFTIERNLQGKQMPGMPVTINCTPVTREQTYPSTCNCDPVYQVAEESIAELQKRRMVLEYKGLPNVCLCMGRPLVSEFDEALAEHLSTWGPHCGAPLTVYEGHLRKLLALQVAPPAPVRPALTRDLVIFDLEGTGLSTETDRIVEIACVSLKPDGTQKEWATRINPEMPIPAEAAAIHGITDADVKDAPTFAKIAAGLHKALQGKDLGGYNLRIYDLPLLDASMRRCGLKLDLKGVNVIDVFGIFANKEGRSLGDAVRKYCGREHDGAHGALSDARATAEVLQAQLGAYPDLQTPMADLAKASRRGEYEFADIAGKLYVDSDGDLRYAMAKVKDVKVKDDSGFAFWMKRQSAPAFPASTIEALDVELKRHGLL